MTRTLLNELKNTYIAMRHGTSIANEKGLIISNPSDGTSMYGLADAGKKEVFESATSALNSGLLNKNTVIYSSDFLRAKETAEITSNVLGLDTNSIIFTKNLRERFFGDFDKTSDSNYENVRSADVLNKKTNNVESVDNVLFRVIELVKYLENKYENKKILLVSHGDTLQILQTAFMSINPSEHRSVKSINTSEIRVISQ